MISKIYVKDLDWLDDGSRYFKSGKRLEHFIWILMVEIWERNRYKDQLEEEIKILEVDVPRCEKMFSELLYEGHEYVKVDGQLYTFTCDETDEQGNLLSVYANTADQINPGYRNNIVVGSRGSPVQGNMIVRTV